MLSPEQKKSYHKAQLFRLLINLADDKILAPCLYFKGGTCSTMLGYLDRFSVDLDFDLKKGADKKLLRLKLHQIFKRLNLIIKDESKKALQFFLKYEAPDGERNTLKLEIIDSPFDSIDHQPQYLKDIDRIVVCQTIECLFANKLVALTDRYRQRGTIAGRDIYDIHYFFSHGYRYKKEVIEERTKKTSQNYLRELITFIENKITQDIIDQDLNFLLPANKFQGIRKTLKIETLMFLKEAVESA